MMPSPSNTHQDIAKVALVLAFVGFGLLDLQIFKRKEIACGSWFFAVTFAAVIVLSFEWLGFLRWVLAPAILISGQTFLVIFSRLGRKRDDDSSVH